MCSLLCGIVTALITTKTTKPDIVTVRWRLGEEDPNSKLEAQGNFTGGLEMSQSWKTINKSLITDEYHVKNRQEMSRTTENYHEDN